MNLKLSPLLVVVFLISGLKAGSCAVVEEPVKEPVKEAELLQDSTLEVTLEGQPPVKGSPPSDKDSVKDNDKPDWVSVNVTTSNSSIKEQDHHSGRERSLPTREEEPHKARSTEVEEVTAYKYYPITASQAAAVLPGSEYHYNHPLSWYAHGPYYQVLKPIALVLPENAEHQPSPALLGGGHHGGGFQPNYTITAEERRIFKPLALNLIGDSSVGPDPRSGPIGKEEMKKIDGNKQAIDELRIEVGTLRQSMIPLRDLMISRMKD